MNIFITGYDLTKEYAEALRNFMSSRGMTCYSYDFEEPVRQMHDSVLLALQQYDVLPERDVFSGPIDRALASNLRSWLTYDAFIPLSTFAEKRLDPITARWDELNIIYYTIIYGDLSLHNLSWRPDSYKILLKGESRPVRDDFNDCAISNIFDQVVDTNKVTPEEAANLIAALLRDKMNTVFSKTPPVPSS